MTPRLGIRENLVQFALLVAINALVGAMVGVERSTLPLLGKQVFALDSATVLSSFLIAFGTAKACANLLSGVLADHSSRRLVLIAGWIVALPVPLLIGIADSWAWIVAANVLLGISQGLAWSSTVIMKIDLSGPRQRGLAMGLNETAGYVAVAVAAFAAGLLATSIGLREALVWSTAIVAVVGLAATILLVRDTSNHASVEAVDHGADTAGMSTAGALAASTWRDPTLSTASHVGLVNNLNDGLAWAIFPLWFATHGASTATVAALAATYPFVWGTCQVAAGWLADRLHRARMIAAGMLLQAGAIAAVATTSHVASWVAALVVLGIGTALVYPTLLAVVAGAAHPSWRARALGAYRMWRDLGYVAGGILAGLIADAYSMRAAMLTVAALTALAGIAALTRMGGDTATAVPAPRLHRAMGPIRSGEGAA